MTPEAPSRNPQPWEMLANVIRQVDGNHDLGAGALAEAILEHPKVRAALATAEAEAAQRVVERIKERLQGVTTVYQDDWAHESGYDTAEVDAILREGGEPDFSACCGNFLDSGECCAAVNGAPAAIGDSAGEEEPGG